MQDGRGFDTAYFREYAVFPGVNTTYIIQYAVISGGQYCLNQVIYSIFSTSILIIFFNMNFFRVVDTAYIYQYAVFSGSRFCLQ